MISRIRFGSLEILPDEEVERQIHHLDAKEDLPPGGLGNRKRDKSLIVFARFCGDEVYPDCSWRQLRSARHEWQEHQVLCQTAIEIQSVVGCPFDCTYCPYSTFLCVRLDVETFVQRVAALARSRRTQALFKLNNRSDTLGLEPEYGLAPALVKLFAGLDEKYLLLYSKGVGVDSLLDLDHRGKTVASFTLTPPSVARLLEQSAPSPGLRIGAMGKLSRAGYPVRVRLSPIVPLRGWQKQYLRLLRSIQKVAQPELLTLWTLSMIELSELPAIVPLESLDPQARRWAEEEAENLGGVKGAPFPPAYRSRLYREIASMAQDILPDSRVSLCLETPQLWRSLGALVTPRKRGRFVCNCGPRVTPQVIASWPSSRKR